MELIFSLIGFTILGFTIRAVIKDSSLAEKPNNNSSWIGQIVLSLIVGFLVWTVLPKKCKESSDDDRIENMIIRR